MLTFRFFVRVQQKLCFLPFLLAATGCTKSDSGLPSIKPPNSFDCKFPQPIKFHRSQQAQAELRGLAAIERFNTRSLGNPGWRQVSITLSSAIGFDDELLVENLWDRQRGVVSTVFSLLLPEGLRGTTYLLREHGLYPQGISVHLLLPVGSQEVVQLSSDCYDEGLLGSNFSYRDMTMLLPTNGFQCQLIGTAMLNDESVDCIDCVEERQAKQKSVRRLYLASSGDLLLGCDVFSESGASISPLKSMRVLESFQTNGVRTATLMVAYKPDRSITTLRLLGMKVFRTNAVQDTYTPESVTLVSRRARNLRSLDRGVDPP